MARALWLGLLACSPKAPPIGDMPTAAPVVLAPASSAPADPLDQSTPASAIRSFARVYWNKRWDLMLRFVPDEKHVTADEIARAWGDRGPMHDEMSRKVRALELSVQRSAIEQTEARATIDYGEGTAVLVLENGVWKIEDF